MIIIFCKTFNEQCKTYGRTLKAVEETIRICVGRDILKEYLEKEKEEVLNIMTTLFDEETIQKNHIASERRDEREKTRIDDIRTVMHKLKFTVNQAMDFLEIPQDQRATLSKLV